MVTERLGLAALAPHALLATTVIFLVPVVAVLSIDTVIVLVPAPDVIDHPDGSVQL